MHLYQRQNVMAVLLISLFCLSFFFINAQAVTVVPNDTNPQLTTLTQGKTTIASSTAKRIGNNEIKKIPLLNQLDYADAPYGEDGTIASHGCGIVCISMVATYLTDTPFYPDELAERFGDYNSPNGSYWTLFEACSKGLEISIPKQTSSWSEVVAALENSQPVISIQGSGLFTRSGHFIVLTGITEDGKILVNDPNGNNWAKNETMKDGFKNGFDQEDIFRSGDTYWIYDAKETPDALGAAQNIFADN